MTTTQMWMLGMLLVWGASAQAAVKLPAIFGDHMVLQQGCKLPVWGWADPGETITVTAAGQKATATAAHDGKWMVRLDPLKASSEPIEVTVAGKNTLTLKNVLVGDVWVCSGQSNMEWPLTATFNAKEESARATFPQIRFFHVAHKVAFQPQDDCEGKWVLCSPETALSFSGVSYYFSRDLHKNLGHPVGMIGSHWSGTPAQAWTSLRELEAHPPLKEFTTAFRKIEADRAKIEEDYFHKTLPAYEKAFALWTEECKKPFEEACKKWAEAVKQAKAEGQTPPPKPTVKQQPPPRYECPTKRADNPTVLNNGMIAPLTPFAIKGVIWYQGESNANNPALYRTLFPALITDWRKQWGQGDFPFLFVQLCSGAGDDVRIPLLREAQASALSLPATGMAVITDCGEPDQPRIHPRNKRDVGSRLALVARHVAYGQDLVWTGPLFKAMQVDSAKARLRFEHVGSGLTIGAPPQPIEGKPPLIPDTALKGFMVAGDDRKFVQAQAQIEGDTVVVWSEHVAKPAAVRYAWKSDPFDANLYNKDMLPAAPFRTDDWH